MISAVTATFGMAVRVRVMPTVSVSSGSTNSARSLPRLRGRVGEGALLSHGVKNFPLPTGLRPADLPRKRGRWSVRHARRLNLEPLDLVPQRAVLALVGRPDLLLRHFAEFIDLGLDHRHAERLELL